MADDDDIEALAAEYVLGTLDAGERSAAEARLASDAAFRRIVAAWERRLQPLADTVPEAMPPAAALDRIMAAIAAPPAPPRQADNVIALRRSVRRWRVTTVLAGAAAAALAGVVVVDRTAPPPKTEYVAVLTAEGAKPAFVATVDTAKGTITVRRVGLAAPPDKSYQLWSIEPNAAPKSLGVVELASLSRDLPVAPTGQATLAISLEPKGGSPTGAPTGPVVFSGALEATE